LPVIAFGWMMIAGLIVSLIVTFLLFPTVLMLIPKEMPRPARGWHFSLTSILARFTQAHGVLIVGLSGFVLICSLIGISRLEVENSFIDYFKDNTEIYQGMKVIDQHLGGTTPLDVIVEFEEPNALPAAESTITEDDDILSLASIVGVAEKLKGDKPLDSLELALLYSETPDEFKTTLIKPYVSVEHNQARFWVRVRDSEKSLRRNELLKTIRADLADKLELDAERFHLAGLLVLYNNMLQSLFSSQIVTLGITVLALTGMFLVLFRSLKLALIAISPNLLSVAAVLGVMGLLNIPLDMMTITIAAISVGIAVDNTIHYIHRFRHEFQKDRKYFNTMHRFQFHTQHILRPAYRSGHGHCPDCGANAFAATVDSCKTFWKGGLSTWNEDDSNSIKRIRYCCREIRHKAADLCHCGPDRHDCGLCGFREESIFQLFVRYFSKSTAGAYCF
jgi:predicted RND superfamily exporter protein